LSRSAKLIVLFVSNLMTTVAAAGNTIC